MDFSVLTMRVWGNSIEQYLAVFLIILITLLFAKILFYIFKAYFQFYAKGKNDLADAIINVFSAPLVWFFTILGFYYATAILALPEGLRIFFWHIIVLALTVDGTYLVLKLIDILVNYYALPFVKATESKLDDQLLPVVQKIVKTLVVIMAIIIALNNLGYNVTSLLAGLGIGGLAVALAAQETIGNFFGSVSIFADKMFEVGDTVKIGEIRGIIKDVGIRSTRIETTDGALVSIPNAKIASERIENLTQIGTKRITQIIGIAYDTTSVKLHYAMDLIKGILENAARKKDIKDKYLVSFVNFGAYTLDVQVIYEIPTVKYERWTPIVEGINFKIKESFDKKGIEFAFPTQTVYVKK